MKTFSKIVRPILLGTVLTTIGMLMGVSVNAYTPFEKERADIRKDLASINYNRMKVNFWKEQHSKAIAADKHTARIIHKRELMKAKADLKCAKSYLRADKKDLMSDHRSAIRNCRSFVAEDRSKLRAAQMSLFVNRFMDDKTARDKDRAAIARHKSSLKEHKKGLQNERVYANTDLIAINKEINKANGQAVVLTSTETAYAKTENWVLK